MSSINIVAVTVHTLRGEEYSAYFDSDAHFLEIIDDVIEQLPEDRYYNKKEYMRERRAYLEEIFNRSRARPNEVKNG